MNENGRLVLVAISYNGYWAKGHSLAETLRNLAKMCGAKIISKKNLCGNKNGIGVKVYLTNDPEPVIYNDGGIGWGQEYWCVSLGGMHNAEFVSTISHYEKEEK